MRKTIGALMIALLLGAGLVAQGEGAPERVTGCINRVFFNLMRRHQFPPRARPRWQSWWGTASFFSPGTGCSTAGLRT